MKIAVQGCCHGALDAIYSHIHTLETTHNYKIDVLLICGDFQAIRNRADLYCMSVPQKYRELGDFWKYYTGEKQAPVLTIVIGGNHEASNYFWELYHGGWLVPNIYFLGHAGCVQVNGLRIAGASGIYKSHDFRLGHHERMPYDYGAIRSIYHIREYNVRRLSLLSTPHIFLSHDWPCTIERHGSVSALLRRKPFFRTDIENEKLGSPPLMGLLKTLKPAWWFAAHLHVRFEGVVKHGNGGTQEERGEMVANPDEIVIESDEEGKDAAQNPDEIVLDDELDAETSAHIVPIPQQAYSETRFLALDKCLPRRDFLEVIDIPAPHDSLPPTNTDKPSTKLTFDPEWLAITRAFDQYFSRAHVQAPFPDEETARQRVAEELMWVRSHLVHSHTNDGDERERGAEASGEYGPEIIEHQVFVQTAPGLESDKVSGSGQRERQPPPYTNPQTVAFCKLLGIEDRISPSPASGPS
ncbi:Metallo-dependent phosphatase-like protein [Scleroderma yunnanense]